MSSKTVYTTEHGRMCPQCGHPVLNCVCGSPGVRVPKGGGNVRVGRETKGRKGKGVTVITGLPVSEEELLNLAKELKQKCATGGTVKEGVIEIQGDHRTMIMEVLKSRGYAAKMAGS